MSVPVRSRPMVQVWWPFGLDREVVMYVGKVQIVESVGWCLFEVDGDWKVWFG